MKHRKEILEVRDFLVPQIFRPGAVRRVGKIVYRPLAVRVPSAGRLGRILPQERTPRVDLAEDDHVADIALSIPDEVFESGETLSKRLGVSRSRLYATALAEFVAKHRGRKVTDRLNAVYGSEDGRLPPSLRRLQSRSLARDPW